jgi:FdrA protein
MNAVASACAIRRSRYVDSVLLMHFSKRLSQEPGVTDAFLIMATEANRSRAADAGYPRGEIDSAGPDDLLSCVRAVSDEAASNALQKLDSLLDEQQRQPTTTVGNIDDALVALPGARLVSISVPGEFAAAEASRALERGLNVFLFSSNVALDDEIALKREASRKGLIVMGPDCGTSIISGVGLGFANRVRRGPIGVVGASGTGIQAITTLAHRMGSGISHALGVGSRDLSDAIGGISTLAALDSLDADDTTEVIVLVAKSTGEDSRAEVKQRTRSMSKPVLECYLSPGGPTLDGTAAEAVRISGRSPLELELPLGERNSTGSNRRTRSPRRRYIRGLFAGGTFCHEAQAILLDKGVEARSNAPLLPHLEIADPGRSEGHTLLDMGSEEYTLGRPHPMIDPRPRVERLLQEGRDPETAMLLIDVVLGYGAAADPAGDLTDALQRVQHESGGEIAVVASVCGTELDPQGLERQAKTLQDAGALVCPTSSAAVDAALELAGVAL